MITQQQGDCFQYATSNVFVSRPNLQQHMILCLSSTRRFIGEQSQASEIVLMTRKNMQMSDIKLWWNTVTQYTLKFRSSFCWRLSGHIVLWHYRRSTVWWIIVDRHYDVTVCVLITECTFGIRRSAERRCVRSTDHAELNGQSSCIGPEHLATHVVACMASCIFDAVFCRAHDSHHM